MPRMMTAAREREPGLPPPWARPEAQAAEDSGEPRLRDLWRAVGRRTRERCGAVAQRVLPAWAKKRIAARIARRL